MVSLHSRALFYDILEALISRQKLKEKADSHVRVHLEKILSEEIEAIKSLKKFESLEAALKCNPNLFVSVNFLYSILINIYRLNTFVFRL